MWKNGAIKVGRSLFSYWMKKYDEPSMYGINGGRISKLTLCRNGEEVLNYDRGWDIEPRDEETRIALEMLLHDEDMTLKKQKMREAIAMLPEGEEFSRAYRAYEGDIRIISVDRNGTERRYRVNFGADGSVSITQF